MADYFQGTFGLIETAAAAVFAVATAVIQDQYQDIANDYYNKYNTQRQFYYNYFQNQGELPFNTEQFGVIFYGPDYIGQTTAYYDALQPLVVAGYFPPGVWNWFGGQMGARTTSFVVRVSGVPTFGYWVRKSQMYAPTGANVVDYSQSSYIEVASILDDWNSYQNRYEEHKRDIYRERRWASQMGSLSYGVKEAYGVERGMGASVENFDEAHGQLNSALSTISNGLATAAGYNKMQKALREDLASVPDYQQNYFLTNVLPSMQ